MYTERPAVVQFFQILGLGVSLGLEAYAYAIDNIWKTRIQKHGRNFICLWLIKSVDYDMFKNKYLVEGGKNSPTYKMDKRYFEKTITRGASWEERAAIIIISLSIALLLFHLVVACISKNYAYRTKWTAAAQGIVVFSCGFSAIFIAISAHNYETSYNHLSHKFPECTLLHVCVGGVYKSEKDLGEFLGKQNFKNDTKSIHHVQRVLKQESVCQEFQLKIAAAVLCGVMILLSLIVICNAMDLTTIYDEEDVDEEEQLRRQAFHMHALHAKRHMHGIGKPVADGVVKELEEIKELERLESERLLAPRAKKSVYVVP